MGYRFLKFTNLYDGMVRQFLSSSTASASLSYQDLHERFVSFLSFSDSYSTHMRELGNDAWEIFPIIELLQKTWAREQAVHYREDCWLRDIAIAQVQSIQPDVIYLTDLYTFDSEFRRQLREATQKPVVIIGWRSAPTTDFSAYQDLDLLLTADPHFVDKFRQHGVRSELLHFGFERTLHDEIELPHYRDLDFTFLGKLGGRQGMHAQRYALVEQIMGEIPLQIWGTIKGPERMALAKKIVFQANRVLNRFGIPHDIRAKLPLIRRGVHWNSDPSLPPLTERYPDRCHAPVFALEYFKILARSKVTLNSHIDVAENYAGNMRLYEATGMGSCLVTDWKDNLSELFEPEKEVVTYRSADECIEKVRYLLEHEEERQKIATAGQQRTFRDHTLKQRIEVLDGIIRQMLRES